MPNTQTQPRSPAGAHPPPNAAPSPSRSAGVIHHDLHPARPIHTSDRSPPILVAMTDGIRPCYAGQIARTSRCRDTEVTLCTLGMPIRAERRAVGRGPRAVSRERRTASGPGRPPGCPGDRTVGPARLGLRSNIAAARGSLAGRRLVQLPRCKRGVEPSPPACPAVAPERPWSLRSPSPVQSVKSPVRQKSPIHQPRASTRFGRALPRPGLRFAPISLTRPPTVRRIPPRIRRL